MKKRFCYLNAWFGLFIGLFQAETINEFGDVLVE